jgi:hypothetical protein
MFLKNILSGFQRLTLQSGRLIAPKCLGYQTGATLNLRKSILLAVNANSSSGKHFFSSSSASHASAPDTSSKLMEFFDDKNNWTEDKVKHGRAWSMDELRLKSNTDLHTLWFVLLKERNMLLTMEEIYAQKNMPMPSHERIAKVCKYVSKRNSLLNIIFAKNKTGR